MTWDKKIFPTILSMVIALGILSLFPIFLGTGPGIALSLSVATLGWIVYLLFCIAKALSSNSSIANEALSLEGFGQKELRQDYNAVKRALKELELDYAMGKLSEEDYQMMRSQYRSRAVLILKQLDQGPDLYRQIQSDLQARRSLLNPPSSLGPTP